MIKELFLLAVVFTLTYDPKTGTLENIAKPVSGTEGYRNSNSHRCNSITPCRCTPKFARRTPVLRPRFNRRSQHSTVTSISTTISHTFSLGWPSR